MSDLYPGAYFRPIDDADGQPATDAVEVFGLHEAVTRATVPTEGRSDIWDWVNSEQSCHVFNGPAGAMEQYIPAGLQSFAMSGGNHRAFAMESWDGLDLQTELDDAGRGPNQTRWTAQQCERIADLGAWLHLEHGVPLRLMLSSQPSEQGWGPHRLGVPDQQPFDSVGGEVWTKHPGKSCPGDLRIAQIPALVDRAAFLAGGIAAGTFGYLPPGPVDLPTALARGGLTPQSLVSTDQEDDMPFTPDQLTDIVTDAVTTALPTALAAWLATGAGQAALGQVVKGAVVSGTQGEFTEVRRELGVVLSKVGAA